MHVENTTENKQMPIILAKIFNEKNKIISNTVENNKKKQDAKLDYGNRTLYNSNVL